MSENNHVVSFEDEPLILVNEADEIMGYKPKLECHQGEGILHRAFSIFIFDDQKELLLQKRSEKKWLWPLYWSNSVCSHPRKGESMEIATQRRLEEEIGFSVPLIYLYKFQYHARYESRGSEKELCSVYIGKYNGPVHANENEIAEWKFVNTDDLEKDLSLNSNRYSPWFKMEWKRIREEFWDRVENL